MITGTTKLLGVIGHPIEHSLSPVMHNAAIAHLGVDYIYVPLSVSAADLPQAIAGLEAIGLQGFNVTIPHKQAIIPLLSHISDVAQAVGAINTVYRTQAGWSGTNTDVEGFLAPLLATPTNWQQARAVILGNGGAARAVVAGCAQLGVAEVQVVGRDAYKLEAFFASWQGSPLATNLSVHLWNELPALLSQAQLIVNTTPIGMFPQSQQSPIDAIELQQITPGTIAYDLIYRPRPTRFLQQAQAQGATIIDGLEMLIQQGAAALHLWLQQAIPIEVMRRSLLDYLAEK